MTDCSPRIAFDFHPRLPIVTSFDAPESSSDGGVLLLRALDERLGLTARFADQLPDGRDPRFVQHPRVEQLRQRVYQIALGYEDCNDATRLRNDRAFKVACDRLAEHAPWATSLVAADARGKLAQGWVNRLRASGQSEFIKTIVELAAKADE